MTNMKLLLAFTFLCSTAYSQDMIWLETPYPSCNSCLDQTFLSCPGYYQDVGYAECMCLGDGGVNLNTCVSVCDGADTMELNVASHAVGSWYLYCTIFYKEMCPGAQKYMDDDLFEKRCGENSGPGLGDVALASTTPSDDGTTSPAKTVESSPTSALLGGATTTANSSPTSAPLGGTATTAKSSPTSTSPKGTATVKSSGTSALSATSAPSPTTSSSSSNAAALVSNSLFGWVIAGLGIQFVGMDL